MRPMFSPLFKWVIWVDSKPSCARLASSSPARFISATVHCESMFAQWPDNSRGEWWFSKSPSALAAHLSEVRVDHRLGLFAPAWLQPCRRCSAAFCGTVLPVDWAWRSFFGQHVFKMFIVKIPTCGLWLPDGHGLLYNLLALQWLGGWGGVDGVKKSDSTQRFQWLSVPEKILF